ncbi:hypothetical protein GW17_00008627 [Ensete ventricosum]|nr:hypothetical protein GW17_00008627 [Ensete ventricosum]RZR81882.1 hypothetical protein BHM03_00008188 [Ensete ventricosum]
MGKAERKKIIIDTDPGIGDRPDDDIRECVHDPRHEKCVAFGIDLKLRTKLRIADFVHGSDGLGNQNFSPPKGKAIDKSAATFLVEKASQFPGEVTVVALGPLTNIALIFGDPDAADIVFTCGADILAVGINVTHQVVLTGT